MGNFANNAITESGRVLLADVQAGAVFIPTKIVIGSGNIPAGKTPATMTDVTTVVKNLDINKKERTPDGKCIIGGVYTNEDIVTDFYFRELALYAKAEYRDEDGNVTQEVSERLYSYGNAGNTADLMPAYSTSTAVEKQIDLVIWIGNDAKVDLTIASGIYIPHEEKGAPGGVAALDEDGVLSLAHRSKLLTNENLNDIIADGYYRAMVNHECENVPDGVTAFGLLVLRVGENMTSGGNCNQILVPHGIKGNIIYTRIVTEGAWDNWRQIALMDNVVSKSGGTISGELIIDETSGFYGVSKKRTITDGTTYIATFGVGFDGSAAIELRSSKDGYNTLVNRLNISPSGSGELVGENASYTIIHEGNIGQYVANLAPATVE